MSSDNNARHFPVTGAGLGLRRALLSPFANPDNFQAMSPISFMEIAPENWINVGGRLGRIFREYTERYPFVTHGLSLSIGGPEPLDETFVRKIGQFIDQHGIRYYSDHLTYCSDDGHLYDLLPIPFTEPAIDYVVERILRVQDILGRQIAIENGSYYANPGQEISEIDFVTSVLEKADCKLLIDINNIYVNSVNHRYDPIEFLKALPGERIAYAHIAGHYNEAEDLIVDTHGASVIPDVWELLAVAYQTFGVFPTLLERDFNIPPLDELLAEVQQIADLQEKHKDQPIAAATYTNNSDIHQYG